MTPKFRRVVTGHDAEGKSIVAIDGPATAFGAFWQTEGAPADNRTSADAALSVHALKLAGASSARVVTGIKRRKSWRSI